ncbi:MAG: hypothetical protein AAB197_02950, partial [Deltaproteobacteria bacterium]
MMDFRRGASIGLEISRECICVVELEAGGKGIAFKKHGKIETPPLLVTPSLSEGNISEPEKFKEAIKNLFNNASISSRHISVAIPDASV